MRIAINTISTKKNSGGAYQIAYNFLMETMKHQEGVEWYYITSGDVDEIVGDEFKVLRGTRYFVFPTQPDFKGTYHQVKKQLAEWEATYHPDLIYTISSPCYFSFSSLEVMRFANAWVTNPNYYAWASLSWKEWLRMRLYRLNQIRLIKNAKYFITQSEAVKRGLQRIAQLGDGKVKVVPNVLPQVYSTAEVRNKRNDKWIDVMCVAAPVPHKNLEIIPKVLKSLKEKNAIENVRFHITLPEDNTIFKKITDECASLGLSDRVINHGRCSQKQLCDIYNSGDFCFMPTLLETFSATSLEAMYFGLPIVATDFEFNKEVIQDAGLFYRPMDAEDAAAKFVSLIQDEALRKELKLKMSRRLTVYNDYEKHFKAIKDYLVQVANKQI